MKNKKNILTLLCTALFISLLFQEATAQSRDTIVYVANSHKNLMKWHDKSSSMNNDTVIITSDSLLISAKEYFHFQQNALIKNIALRDILTLKKMNLYPAIFNPWFMVDVLGVSAAGYIIMPVLNYALAGAFVLMMYPTIRENRMIEITLRNNETIFLYAGFKTRKIHRKIKQRLENLH